MRKCRPPVRAGPRAPEGCEHGRPQAQCLVAPRPRHDRGDKLCPLPSGWRARQVFNRRLCAAVTTACLAVPPESTHPAGFRRPAHVPLQSLATAPSQARLLADCRPSRLCLRHCGAATFAAGAGLVVVGELLVAVKQGAPTCLRRGCFARHGRPRGRQQPKREREQAHGSIARLGAS